MKYRTIGVGIVAAMAVASVAEARDFTVASWGGTYQDGLREIFFAPFGEENQISVLEDTYLGGWGQFKAMQDTGEVKWDVVQVEAAELMRGCEEGLFTKLDWARLGGKDRFVAGGANDCGLGVVATGEVIVFNDNLTGDTQPKTLQDFFDIQTWPGKRGLRDDVKSNLVRALLADGVAGKDIYKVLATPEGVDRAFAKLDSIKPEVIFWTAGAQPIERLNSGDYVMSIAYSGRAAAAQQEGKTFMRTSWDNAFVYIDSWAILADSAYQEEAYAFLNYFADVDREVTYTTEVLPYGPVLKDAAAALSADVAKLVPAGDNIANATVWGSQEDIEFWIDHLDELTARWNEWKARS